MSSPRLLALFLLAAAVAAPPRRAAAACAAERFSGNRVFATCVDLPHLSASLHWTYDTAASSLSVAFLAAPPSGGWVAWGLNPTAESMSGTQALIAVPKGGGAYEVQTYGISGYSLGSRGPLSYPTSDLAAELGGDGRVRIFGTLKLQNGTGEVNQVWQVGPFSGGAIGTHSTTNAENLNSKGKLNLLTGASTAASGGSSVLRKRNTHGVLNAVSWGLLLPMGAIFARYLKTFKSADPAWFYLHVACQLIGYGVGVSGWATGIHLGNMSKGITYSVHRNIGIAVFALGTLQDLKFAKIVHCTWHRPRSPPPSGDVKGCLAIVDRLLLFLVVRSSAAQRTRETKESFRKMAVGSLAGGGAYGYGLLRL